MKAHTPALKGKGVFFRTKGYHLLKVRHSQISQVYSLTAVTEQRKPILRDVHLGRLVIDQLRRQDQAGHTHSLAWVVMPVHIHWLFELQARSLGVVMCPLKSRSSLSLNHTTHSHGRVWQKGLPPTRRTPGRRPQNHRPLHHLQPRACGAGTTGKRISPMGCRRALTPSRLPQPRKSAVWCQVSSRRF